MRTADKKNINFMANDFVETGYIVSLNIWKYVLTTHPENDRSRVNDELFTFTSNSDFD